MITIRRNTVSGFRVATWILLCILQASTAAALNAWPAEIAIAERINARLADVMARVGFRKNREKVPDNPDRVVQNVPKFPRRA